MAIYQLSDGNRIVADADFIAEHFPDAVLVPDPLANPNATIFAQLDEIYASINKPRTQAELAGGDATAQAWVQSQLAAAAALRAQLVK